MSIDQTIQPLTFNVNRFIKAAVLLTIGIFLISAPTPDARVISDITSNMIVIASNLASKP